MLNHWLHLVKKIIYLTRRILEDRTHLVKNIIHTQQGRLRLRAWGIKVALSDPKTQGLQWLRLMVSTPFTIWMVNMITIMVLVLLFSFWWQDSLILCLPASLRLRDEHRNLCFRCHKPGHMVPKHLRTLEECLLTNDSVAISVGNIGQRSVCSLSAPENSSPSCYEWLFEYFDGCTRRDDLDILSRLSKYREEFRFHQRSAFVLQPPFILSNPVSTIFYNILIGVSLGIPIFLNILAALAYTFWPQKKKKQGSVVLSLVFLLC